jgi:hypothetical protein
MDAEKTLERRDMTDEPPKRGRGRPRLPEGQHKRLLQLSTTVSEDYGLKVRIEANRRGLTYSQLVRAFVEAGMVVLSEQRAA